MSQSIRAKSQIRKTTKLRIDLTTEQTADIVRKWFETNYPEWVGTVIEVDIDGGDYQGCKFQGSITAVREEIKES